MNIEEMKAWLEKHDIVEVECIAASMTGDTLGKFISAKKFLDGKLRMPESIIAMTVTGVYPDSHFDYMDARDIDADFHPDFSTARLVPWAKKPTAQVIHDFVNKKGELHPLAARTVLKNILELYENEGWTPVVAPEMEFYLVDRNTDSSQELRPPSGTNGRRETMPNAYSVEGINEYSDFVKDLYDTCEKQNIPVEGLVHEVGIAQFEINFMHGNALNLADQVFAFKRTVRQVALEHGFYATFMAKPYSDQPGSAMHIHQSVVDQTGNNIFVDGNGQHNDTFKYFIGGTSWITL